MTLPLPMGIGRGAHDLRIVGAFTPGGAALGKRLADALGGTLHVPARLAQSTGMPSYDSLEAWTASHWETGRALVFIGAAGIAVRAIAPHVQDKFRDPRVVSVDETGQYAVALLSGHVGGMPIRWPLASPD